MVEVGFRMLLEGRPGAARVHRLGRGLRLEDVVQGLADIRQEGREQADERGRSVVQRVERRELRGRRLALEARARFHKLEVVVAVGGPEELLDEAQRLGVLIVFEGGCRLGNGGGELAE